MSMEREVKNLLQTLGVPVVWGMFGRDVGFPRISIVRVGTVTGYSLLGRADVETARIQINLDAKTYGEIISLGRQVSELMTDYRSGVVIRCKELSRRDGMSEGGGEIIRRQMLDMQVRYRT